MGKITAPLWIEQQAWATFETIATALGLSRSALIELLAAAYQRDEGQTVGLLQQLPGADEFTPKKPGPPADYDYSKRKAPRKRKKDETGNV